MIFNKTIHKYLPALAMQKHVSVTHFPFVISLTRYFMILYTISDICNAEVENCSTGNKVGKLILYRKRYYFI